MLASLLLLPLFAWSVPASPSVSLPSFNTRHSAEAFNVSTELWSLAPFNKSSRVVGSLARGTFGEYTGCLGQDPSVPHEEATYLDCLNAAWKMDVGNDPRARRYISRHRRYPDRDFLVPAAFIRGSCIIYVDTVNDNDHDMLSMLDIRRVVLEVIDQCVKPSPHLGGKDLVGRKQVIKVLVFGHEASKVGTVNVS